MGTRLMVRPLTTGFFSTQSFSGSDSDSSPVLASAASSSEVIQTETETLAHTTTTTRQKTQSVPTALSSSSSSSSSIAPNHALLLTLFEFLNETLSDQLALSPSAISCPSGASVPACWPALNSLATGPALYAERLLQLTQFATLLASSSWVLPAASHERLERLSGLLSSSSDSRLEELFLQAQRLMLVADAAQRRDDDEQQGPVALVRYGAMTVNGVGTDGVERATHTLTQTLGSLWSALLLTAPLANRSSVGTLRCPLIQQLRAKPAGGTGLAPKLAEVLLLPAAAGETASTISSTQFALSSARASSVNSLALPNPRLTARRVPACVRVGSGQARYLQCPSAQLVVREILFASYGTPEGGLCDSSSSFAIGDCHAPDSLSVVSRYCLGRSGCWIYAYITSYLYAADPCPTVPNKRTFVQVLCGEPDDTGSVQLPPMKVRIAYIHTLVVCLSAYSPVMPACLPLISSPSHQSNQSARLPVWSAYPIYFDPITLTELSLLME